MILGSRAELAIRRTWRSFAHPSQTQLAMVRWFKKEPRTQYAAGQQGRLGGLYLQAKSILSQAQIARCDRHHILAVTTSLPQWISILTTHFEGAVGPERRDPRHTTVPEVPLATGSSLLAHNNVCTASCPDDYATTTP